MKKLLMTVLLILLLVATYFIIFKNVSLGSWTSKSVTNIKDASQELENKINDTIQKNEQDYPQSIADLEQTIKQFEATKAKYDVKYNYASQNYALGMVEIKEYKIETLWIEIQNYAKKRNIELTLNIVQSSAFDSIYNLEITVIGEYDNIISFLYDIEDDNDLNFKIENFKMVPSKTSTVTSTSNTISTTKSDETENGTTENETTEEKTTYTIQLVEATFVVNDVQIDNINGSFN